MNSSISAEFFNLPLQYDKVYIPAIGLVITAPDTGHQRPNQLPGLPVEIYILTNKKTRIIRTRKRVIRNMRKKMFGVAVARLTKVSVELPPLYRTILVGYRAGRRIWSHGWRVCDRHQKILKLKSSLGFLHLLCVYHIFRLCKIYTLC